MLEPQAIFIAIAALFIILNAAVLIIAVKKGAKARNAIKDLNIGDINPFAEPRKKFSKELDGYTIYFNYSPRRKNHSASFEMYITGLPEAEFEVSKENKSDRISKALSLSREFQTGESLFDNNFYIASDDDILCREIFTNSECKQAVQKLLTDSADNLRLKNGMLTLRISPVDVSRFNAPTILNGMCQNMAIFAAKIPAAAAVPHPIRVGTQVPTVKIVNYSPVVIAISGFALIFVSDHFYAPVDSTSLFFESLRYSGPAFFGFMAFAVATLKGSSRAHRDLFLIFVISLFGIPVLGYGLMATLNGYLDTNPVTTFEQPILKKFKSSGKKKSYHLEVKSWRKPALTEMIRVDYETYSHANPEKGTLLITSGPGYFQHPYITKIQLPAITP